MPQGSVLTIGNFDGVHLGHQAILRRGRALADELGGRLLAMTFDPFPVAVLRPGSQPPRLMSLDQRMAALRQAGADEVVVLKPTAELLAQTPEQFLGWLVERHHPGALVEGANFRFGKGRAGDVELLQRLAPAMGWRIVVVGPVRVALDDLLTTVASSSLVRWLVGQGRVADAARCCGRWFELTGPVVEGEKRGRTLSVPTANLDAAALADRAVPPDGVYAGSVDTGDGVERPAAVSIGVKPTFGRHQRVIEAHLLDFSGDLYGRTIALRLARWLRGQQVFPAAADLLGQIHRDLAETRRLAALGLLASPPRILPVPEAP